MARKSRKHQNVTPEDVSAPLYKAAIYIRLSCKNKEDTESNSLGNQKKICMAYLERQTDMVYCQTYMDNGMTGTNFVRPGFQKMLDDIEKNLINCVIVKDLSRFGRNFIETSMYLDLKFPEWGVRLIAVNNGFDSLFARYEGGGYNISVPFYNIMSEWYAADIGRKVKTALRTKMKNKDFFPGEHNIPFGYFLDRENRTYLIDPVGAEVVRYIYQRRADGATHVQIRDELNEKKYPTPTARKVALGIYDANKKKYQTVEGFYLWSNEAVEKILRNNVYSGVREHLKRCMGEETLVFKNAHEAIVSPEVFEKARLVEAERRLLHMEHQKAIYVPNYKATINDRVFCGLCGAQMYIQSISCQRKNPSFSCSTHTKDVQSRRDVKCAGAWITGKQVTKVLITVLHNQISMLDDMDQMATTMEAELKTTSEYKHYLSKQRSIRIRLNNARSRLASLPRDLVEGHIAKEKYLQAKDEQAEKARLLELEEQEVKNLYNECFSPVLRLKKAMDMLRTFQRTEEVNEDLLSELVKKIVIFPDKRVEITLTYQDVFKQDGMTGGGANE